jgi:RNA polymerase sigma factor (TIGR02999 family)
VSQDPFESSDSEAAGRLQTLVYEELRKMAAQKMAREGPNQTLQATALVHEAWLRLRGHPESKGQDHARYLAAAANAMRRILIDNARRKKAQRHGGGWVRVDLDGLELAANMEDDQLLAVDEALDRLAAHDALKAELVNLRFFAGLTLEESAKVLELSLSTAKRHWAYARAWLYREIEATKI